jgi:hypothetical protein
VAASAADARHVGILEAVVAERVATAGIDVAHNRGYPNRDFAFISKSLKKTSTAPGLHRSTDRLSAVD